MGTYRSGEERSRGKVILDEGALNNVLLTTHGGKKAASKDLASISHGQSGRAGTVLGLDNLVTTELNTMSEGGDVSVSELSTRNLGQKRQDGSTSMATNDRDLGGAHIKLLVLRNEGIGTDNVKSGNTEQTARIVNT